MSIRKPVIHSFVCIVILLTCGASFGQDLPSSGQFQQEIRQLIEGLQRALTAGSPVDRFFSPSVNVNERHKIDALQSQGFLTFEIVDYTLKDLRVQDAQHASLPVTVKWSTRTQEASRTATLRFVKEQGTWYFADAEFWEVSVWWFFFPLIAIAIAYGIGVVMMYWHASRQQWVNSRRKTLWQALSIVPLIPFFYFARKPWTTQ